MHNFGAFDEIELRPEKPYLSSQRVKLNRSGIAEKPIYRAEDLAKLLGVSTALVQWRFRTGMRGWRGYFGFCETPDVLIQLTRWVRLRLRVALWRQWKTPRRRRAMLIQLGVRAKLAANAAGSAHGPWHLAHSKALHVALSNAYFRDRGLPSLFEQC